MKKLGLLILTVSILFVNRTTAQGLHLGIKAGSNFSQLNGRSFTDDFKAGFLVGAFAELNVSSKWGIQPELLFSQTKSQTESNFFTIYPAGLNSQSVTLNYLNIPILLTYRPIPILGFQIGPQFGTLLSTSQNITGNGANAFKNGDVSGVIGAQVNLGLFKAGARYTYGFTNINDLTSSSIDTWKNRGIQLYVGLRVF